MIAIITLYSLVSRSHRWRIKKRFPSVVVVNNWNQYSVTDARYAVVGPNPQLDYVSVPAAPTPEDQV